MPNANRMKIACDILWNYSIHTQLKWLEYTDDSLANLSLIIITTQSKHLIQLVRWNHSKITCIDWRVHIQKQEKHTLQASNENIWCINAPTSDCLTHKSSMAFKYQQFQWGIKVGGNGKINMIERQIGHVQRWYVSDGVTIKRYLI